MVEAGEAAMVPESASASERAAVCCPWYIRRGVALVAALPFDSFLYFGI